MLISTTKLGINFHKIRLRIFELLYYEYRVYINIVNGQFLLKISQLL